MKRQAAFVSAGKMLKGALHCHTTRSDGKGEVSEVIRLHKENGYDFMAVTDHRLYNYDNFGVDGITILPGMEMDGNFPRVQRAVHCHHIVCIGPKKEDGNGYTQDQQFERWTIERPEDTQAHLDEIHKNGNLTIYAHPQWSGTPAREFEMLRGNFAMEVWNSGCAIENRLDMDAAYWDELLAQGIRIFGVATDDGHAMSHHCKGWVRVNSENNVPAILQALKKGAFYASCGPEIFDFYVEDGVAHIKCSPVKEIHFIHLRVPYKLHAAPYGEVITEASESLRMGGYIRATVVDTFGRRAWTNPIFLEDDDVK